MMMMGSVELMPFSIGHFINESLSAEKRLYFMIASLFFPSFIILFSAQFLCMGVCIQLTKIFMHDVKGASPLIMSPTLASVQLLFNHD